MLLELIINRQKYGKLTQKEINFLNYISNEYNQKECKENHCYGYAPFTPNGSCRFCWGIKYRDLKTLVTDFTSININSPKN
jgi:hypothetical protein